MRHGRTHVKKRSIEGETMNKEQLLAAGLTEEQVTAVLKVHKDVLDNQFVPKHRFDEVNGELKTAKEQVKDRDTQIADLKKFEGNAEALATKIADLEKANEDKDTIYKQELALEKKKNAIKLALLEDEKGKPFDVDMVMGLFDLDKVSYDLEGGKITSGYEEQSKAIREEKTFLFSSPEKDPTTPKNKGWTPKGTPPPDGDKGGGGTDPAISYGKNLAQTKLGMLGVTKDS